MVKFKYYDLWSTYNSDASNVENDDICFITGSGVIRTKGTNFISPITWGTSGQVLISNGSNAVPTWSTIQDYDSSNGHDYVEIGGVKWATMNVGATSVTEGGLFFNWGGTQGYTAEQIGSGENQKYFGAADCPYTENASGTTLLDSNITKYGSVDGLCSLLLEDDAVHANWGGNWRMPTLDEISKLLDSATITEESVNGTNVIKFTDKTDSSKFIYIPEIPYASNGSVKTIDQGSVVIPTRNTSWYISWFGGVVNRLDFFVNSDFGLLASGTSISSGHRYLGFLMRGVLDPDLSATIENQDKHLPTDKYVADTSVTIRLAPNRQYSFREMESITITLGERSKRRITRSQNQNGSLGTPFTYEYPTLYMFEFDSGSTPTTLSMPANIIWQDDPSSPEANKHYEINIKYDLATNSYYGLWTEWDLPTE